MFIHFIYLWYILFYKSGYWPVFTHFIYLWFILFYKSGYWPEFYLSLVYFILQKRLLAHV